jgi:hypothetical protein
MPKSTVAIAQPAARGAWPLIWSTPSSMALRMYMRFLMQR